ncbi:MAG: hypothetical protein IIB72_10210 [Proteobacteria bacterium]|nr:hypothetical protein [Pseudomonadota bacterium]
MKLAVKTFALASVLTITGNIAAQDHSADEEQIIIDDLSRAELRAEIEKVENEFYREFSASIDEARLKINCSTYIPTGSHIPQRTCEPKFLSDARNRNVKDWQIDVDVLQSPQDIRSGMGAEFEELTAAMNVVLKENQYFRELNGILRMLRARMEEL